MKAFVIAMDNPLLFNHFIEPIKDDFESLYPNSKYRTELLEIETIKLWDNKQYNRALKNLKYIFSSNPLSQICTQLEYEFLPADAKKDFLFYLKRTENVNNFDISPQSGITLDDISTFQLKRLKMPSIRANSLQPLEGMPIQWLWFPNNQIEDLYPLRDMPLQTLFGNNNHLVDLSPLSKMPLHFLHLKGNNIYDITPLTDLPIQSLDVSQNRIANLDPLTNLPLKELNISSNEINTVDALKGIKLSRLFIDNNSITALLPLHKAPLQVISFRNNWVSDLSPLRDSPLEHIHAGSNQIKDISSLTGLNLHYLNLDNNQIINFEPLNRVSVNTLVLSRNNIKELSALFSPDLKSLNIGHNRLSTLDKIKYLELEKLNCSHNNILSLEPLEGMDVKMINCQDNLLSSLYPLYETPPDTFLFDNKGITSIEIEEVIRLWSQNPRYRYNVYYAKLVLYIRNRNIKALRSLAKEYSGHLYLHITRKMSWEQAEQLCMQLGGHLATITSRRENLFISSVLRDNYPAWIGLKSENKQWKWVSGSSLTYSNTHHRYEAHIFPTLLITGRHNNARWIADADVLESGFVIEWDN